ncbi:hypothetical protein JW979_04210 [bacterium]|nr:hypothetical protein [candidate division CSSED10-310 bacterium]
MTVHCPVNVVYDLTVPIAPCTHYYIVPPMTNPVPTVAIEMVATQLWTFGFVLNQNKFTTTVFHKGVWITLANHNLGPMIPDVTIPPVNAWYAVMWPFSSRKIMFSSSTVKMNGQPVGCAAIFPPFVMLTCGEPVSLPVTAPATNLLNNVHVGMTWADILAGALDIVASMAIDLVFALIGARGSGRSVAQSYRNVFRNMRNLPVHGLRNLFRGGVGRQVSQAIMQKFFNPSDLAKNLVSGLTGFGTSALTGDPQFRMGVGNPWLGGEVSYDTARDSSTGERRGVGGEFHAVGSQLGTDGARQWGSTI